MKVIYFYHQGLGYAPVKKYLAQYQTKKLAEIHARIQHLLDINGLPKPPIAKQLKGHSISQTGIGKTAKILIRILFFRHKDTIVLVHVFEKPAHYSGTKIEKEIEAEYDIADGYKLIFESNPKSYEDYP